MLTPAPPLSVSRCQWKIAALLTGCIFLAGFCPPTARSQTLYLKDGQTIPALGLSRSGDTVIARVQTQAGTQGESGYPANNIARVDFPEPAQLKLANDLLNAGKTEEAVRELTPIVAYYSPFRDLPGNWWLPLALLQVDALARLGRDRDADGLINDIARLGGAPPDALRAVKIKQAASLERRGEHRKALDVLAPVVKDPAATMDTLTEAWLTVGSARLNLREYREALLAFLRVPVYTPDRALLMPPALLGAANAYIALDDKPRAQTALKELLASYPSSPEAAAAKERLQKLTARMPKPTGG